MRAAAGDHRPHRPPCGLSRIEPDEHPLVVRTFRQTRQNGFKFVADFTHEQFPTKPDEHPRRWCPIAVSMLRHGAPAGETFHDQFAPDPTLPVDDEARALARHLVRTGRSGALATNDAGGMPFASLVALATDTDGSPVILTSQLSTHTRTSMPIPAAPCSSPRPARAIRSAHPRVTFRGEARKIDRAAPDGARTRRRYWRITRKLRFTSIFRISHSGAWRLRPPA